MKKPICAALVLIAILVVSMPASAAPIHVEHTAGIQPAPPEIVPFTLTEAKRAVIDWGATLGVQYVQVGDQWAAGSPSYRFELSALSPAKTIWLNEDSAPSPPVLDVQPDPTFITYSYGQSGLIYLLEPGDYFISVGGTGGTMSFPGLSKNWVDIEFLAVPEPTSWALGVMGTVIGALFAIRHVWR